jgi:hypothetical protein
MTGWTKISTFGLPVYPALPPAEPLSSVGKGHIVGLPEFASQVDSGRVLVAIVSHAHLVRRIDADSGEWLHDS